MGQRMGDESVLASSPSWQYGRGRVSIMATVTLLPRATEVVYGVAGAVAIVRAKGEGEGRTDATRRRGVLARPVTCQCTLWRAQTW
jgi:hypothetical protein